MQLLTSQLPLPNPSAAKVPMALFRRHLGLPACAELDERLVALADDARSWYSQHGDPWTVALQVEIHRIIYDVIHLTHGHQLSSALLAQGLALARANALVIVAVTAGKAVDDRIDELWKSDRPDEAMFLNAYAIALVEHLRWQAGAHLRSLLREENLTVLPHYSPGYDGWDLADQGRLFRIIGAEEEVTGLPLKLHASGGLSPNKSTLAAYGVTRRTDFPEDLDQFWVCRSVPISEEDCSASYAFPEKALCRWRDKRLQMTAQGNDELQATFRFDGSTCTNMGVPLAFDYVVKLKRNKDRGYDILGSDCEPAEDHIGYQSMCAYLDNPDRFMSQLKSHRPLAGRTLHEALTWRTPISPAGCLCTRASQDHKWRIVLQTIHYALESHE
jgi:hypothetical protein